MWSEFLSPRISAPNKYLLISQLIFTFKLSYKTTFWVLQEKWGSLAFRELDSLCLHAARLSQGSATLEGSLTSITLLVSSILPPSNTVFHFSLLSFEFWYTELYGRLSPCILSNFIFFSSFTLLNNLSSLEYNQFVQALLKIKRNTRRAGIPTEGKK